MHLYVQVPTIGGTDTSIKARVKILRREVAQLD